MSAFISSIFLGGVGNYFIISGSSLGGKQKFMRMPVSAPSDFRYFLSCTSSFVSFSSSLYEATGLTHSGRALY
jgi:hypothetical protein